MNEKHEFLEDMLIVIMKPTIDVFLKQDNPGDLIALYAFYYYTAKWQGTNQPKCTTSYAANGLRWGEGKVRKVKKQLCDIGLIEDVAVREGGRITGHYIRVRYKLKNDTEKMILHEIDGAHDDGIIHPCSFPQCGENHSVVAPHCGKGHSVEDEGTNAYSSDTLNAYSSGNSNACNNGNGNAYRAIIDHLNEKTGTSYKASSKKTQSLIRARLQEGFTIDDFKIVIDKKSAEWMGDAKMEKYLRPETLFGTKFENYLNAKATGKGGNPNGKHVGNDGGADGPDSGGLNWGKLL